MGGPIHGFFMTDLLISADWLSNSYDSILVIVDCLTKMVHYKLVKVTIDVLSLAKVIINMVVYYHRVLESIITN